ncbi:MAG: HaeIII family restriction endonuclease, partial [Treponema sp.]|nr:HaeIII family restriction endonuclease [Treponema sp.]
MSKSTIKSTVMGKAYEYACIIAIEKLLRKIRPLEIVKNSSLNIARDRYNEVDINIQKDMLKSATAGIEAIILMEPKIVEDGKDKLTISLQPDNVAKNGDIRDVLIIR